MHWIRLAIVARFVEVLKLSKYAALLDEAFLAVDRAEIFRK